MCKWSVNSILLQKQHAFICETKWQGCEAFWEQEKEKEKKRKLQNYKPTIVKY